MTDDLLKMADEYIEYFSGQSSDGLAMRFDFDETAIIIKALSERLRGGKIVMLMIGGYTDIDGSSHDDFVSGLFSSIEKVNEYIERYWYDFYHYAECESCEHKKEITRGEETHLIPQFKTTKDRISDYPCVKGVEGDLFLREVKMDNFEL